GWSLLTVQEKIAAAKRRERDERMKREEKRQMQSRWKLPVDMEERLKNTAMGKRQGQGRVGALLTGGGRARADNPDLGRYRASYSNGVTHVSGRQLPAAGRGQSGNGPQMAGTGKGGLPRGQQLGEGANNTATQPVPRQAPAPTPERPSYTPISPDPFGQFLKAEPRAATPQAGAGAGLMPAMDRETRPRTVPGAPGSMARGRTAPPVAGDRVSDCPGVIRALARGSGGGSPRASPDCSRADVPMIAIHSSSESESEAAPVSDRWYSGGNAQGPHPNINDDKNLSSRSPSPLLSLTGISRQSQGWGRGSTRARARARARVRDSNTFLEEGEAEPSPSPSPPRSPIDWELLHRQAPDKRSEFIGKAVDRSLDAALLVCSEGSGEGQPPGEGKPRAPGEGSPGACARANFRGRDCFRWEPLDPEPRTPSPCSSVTSVSSFASSFWEFSPRNNRGWGGHSSSSSEYDEGYEDNYSDGDDDDGDEGLAWSRQGRLRGSGVVGVARGGSNGRYRRPMARRRSPSRSTFGFIDPRLLEMEMEEPRGWGGQPRGGSSGG
ncbi:unnamed protein product, partial [Discosporangium mesarthrocarpum]